jgi:hypothetical protein
MRDSYTQQGIRADDNPLSVTWHWGPLDDIDADAAYEPVDGAGIAWLVPEGTSSYRPEGHAVYFGGPDYWIDVSYYDGAAFKAVDTPFTDETGDGWRLMSIGDVDAVIYQRHYDTLAGFFNGDTGRWCANGEGEGLAKLIGRHPRAQIVSRLISVDAAIRG